MSSALAEGLLWSAMISSGLMAGIYFAFSGFIMRSFASLPLDHAAAAASDPERSGMVAEARSRRNLWPELLA